MPHVGRADHLSLVLHDFLGLVLVSQSPKVQAIRHFCIGLHAPARESLAKLGQMQALKEMEQTVQDAPDHQVSLTDPDARSRPTSGKGTATLGCNVQIPLA